MMEPRVWCLSSKRMTVRVSTDAAQRIVEAAPVVRKFLGYPLDHLVQWMRRQGGFWMEELTGPPAAGEEPQRG